MCGKVARTETTIITDAEQSQIRVNYAIKVTNVIPCPRQSYFYSKSGRVDQQKLKSFLGKEMANVVAWYKHKSFRDFKLSLRDKIVHKQVRRSLFKDFYEKTNVDSTKAR